MRIATRTFVLALAALAMVAGEAQAAPTAEQSCEKALSLAAGTYLQCMEKAMGTFYGGDDYAGKVAPAFGKCVDKYSATWPKLVKKYDGKGTSCTGDRYADNGDGTFADRLTSLVWEKKTDDGGIHDKDNFYTWTTGSPGKEDGTVFATFLKTLNSSPTCPAGYGASGTYTSNLVTTGTWTMTFDPSGTTWTAVATGSPVGSVPCSGGVTGSTFTGTCVSVGTASVSGSFDCGSQTVTLSFSSPSPYPVTGSGTGTMMATGGFGGSNGWRLPSIYELNTLVEPGYPNCSGAPCTTVPGETVSGFYWSSSTNRLSPGLAWDVDFGNGVGSFDNKSAGYYVRAVRGGS